MATSPINQATQTTWQLLLKNQDAGTNKLPDQTFNTLRQDLIKYTGDFKNQDLSSTRQQGVQTLTDVVNAEKAQPTSVALKSLEAALTDHINQLDKVGAANGTADDFIKAINQDAAINFHATDADVGSYIKSVTRGVFTGPELSTLSAAAQKPTLTGANVVVENPDGTVQVGTSEGKPFQSAEQILAEGGENTSHLSGIVPVEGGEIHPEGGSSILEEFGSAAEIAAELS